MVHSKCPAHYVRPRAAIVHSHRGSCQTRLIAQYIAAHLVLGGYTEVDVGPWADELAAEVDEASHSTNLASMSIKELKRFIAERGVHCPAGSLERRELVEAAARCRGRRVVKKVPSLRVVRHHSSSDRDAKAETLSELDCRVMTSARDLRVAVETCALVVVVIDADDGAACGAWVREALGSRTGIASDAIPVVVLAAEVMTHESFASSFDDMALPLPRVPVTARGLEKPEPRELSGRPLVISGAACFVVGTRVSDGALVALTRGSLVVERLDAERDSLVSKFYDLLTTSGIPMDYIPRVAMTTVTWGHLLVSGPLLAVEAAVDCRRRNAEQSLPFTGPRAALESCIDVRKLVANAMREARLALDSSAAKVRRAAVDKACIAERDGRARGSSNNTRRSSHARSHKWAPKLSTALRNSAALCGSYRGLEILLLLPGPLFSFLVATQVLGLPRDAVVSPAVNDLASTTAVSMASRNIDALIDACTHAKVPCPTLDALRAALADTRVRGERTQSATTIYGNAGRPKGAAEFATVLLRCILFAALITPAMVLAVELLVPTRGTQTRTLYAGATDL